MAKKYSLNMEGDEVVSVEVDGIHYDSPDDIPDPEDRARVLDLMPLSPGMPPSLPTGKPFPFEKVIIAVFLFVAALTLSIAGITAANVLDSLSREQSAPGKVVDLVTQKDDAGNEFSYPVVEFELPDGSRKTIEIPEGSRPPAYEKGEAVTVLYDPADPTDARIDSASSLIVQWILPAITGILGVAFTIASLVAIWVLRAGSSDARPQVWEREGGGA